MIGHDDSEFNTSYILDREMKISPQRYDPLKRMRIITIQALLGVRDISDAFENPMNRSEVELLVGFFDRKYDLSNGDNDPYNFIRNVIGISEEAFELIGANQQEYYIHMDTFDALESIIYSLIDRSNNMENKNGFPANFNFTASQINKIQDYEGNKYFPYANNLSYNNSLIKIK